MDIVALRYSESLFDLALEQTKVREYSDDMQLVNQVFQDQELISFFSNMQVSDQLKYEMLDQSFKTSIDDYVLNFLKLLVKKRRFKLISDIVKAYQVQTNKYLGIEEGIVQASYQLSQEEITTIEKALSNKTGKTIKLKPVVDKTLIGGIRVEVANKVYDSSIKNKLVELKKELIRK